jgi:3-phenylpropionate/trans-cinnamate dioxygenase ferredoxin subunit
MSTINLGPADALEDGVGKRFDVDGERIAVFRIDSDVYAIADRCSHAEASLAEGEVFDTEVECPRHGASFDLTTGAVLSLPASKPVATFPAEVVDGDVLVTLQEASDG